MITTRSVFAAGRLFLMLAGACLLIGSSAQAQNGGAYQDGGYKPRSALTMAACSDWATARS